MGIFLYGLIKRLSIGFYYTFIMLIQKWIEKIMQKKLNEYFKNSGINYEYKKNDENIYNLLCKYGSLDKARNNSKKINEEHKNDEPSLSESCTVVHRLFDEIDERLKELE